MRCVLGFDGGGTKTDCVLVDEVGKILARAQGGPSNPMRIGFGAAIASIRDAAMKAIAEAAPGGKAQIAGVCAGLSGAGHPESAEKMHNLLAAEFPQASIRVCTDLDLALAAAGEGPAIVLIAGTGSVAIGRNSANEIARAGGYGPQIGDEGNAYDIGRRGVLVSMREYDRAGTDSPLGKRILRELHCSDWADVRARAQAAADEVFPRLFSVVAALAENDDACAQGLLRAAAFELASIAETVAERLHLRDTRFFLAKTGGMIGRSKFLEEQLDERLRNAFPHAEIGTLGVPPAEVAARMALGLIASGAAKGSEK